VPLADHAAATATPAPGDQQIQVGRVGAAHGVRGWVRVHSDTDPPENILRYRPWQVGDKTLTVVEGQRHGKALIVRFDGVEARDAAAALTGTTVSVRRSQLPPPRQDEFYWVDLEGLAVQTPQGVALGTVSHLFATGANDVLVVTGERERLVPFIWGDVVRDVDFARGLVTVDWDPSF
jgi:16S rRNA processing protein RimM